MKRVLLESPFAGDEDRNKLYGRLCEHDCLVRRGEAPFAGHLLYTQRRVLNDAMPAERQLGMEAGFVWGEVASASVFYTDLGVSYGMSRGLNRAVIDGRPVEERKLPDDLWAVFVADLEEAGMMVPSRNKSTCLP